MGTKLRPHFFIELLLNQAGKTDIRIDPVQPSLHFFRKLDVILLKKLPIHFFFLNASIWSNMRPTNVPFWTFFWQICKVAGWLLCFESYRTSTLTCEWCFPCKIFRWIRFWGWIGENPAPCRTWCWFMGFNTGVLGVFRLLDPKSEIYKTDVCHLQALVKTHQLCPNRRLGPAATANYQIYGLVNGLRYSILWKFRDRLRALQHFFTLTEFSSELIRISLDSSGKYSIRRFPVNLHSKPLSHFSAQTSS